ncbi:hypothetical protein HaLaN_14975, partial [Haematococcus lacustris]
MAAGWTSYQPQGLGLLTRDSAVSLYCLVLPGAVDLPGAAWCCEPAWGCLVLWTCLGLPGPPGGGHSTILPFSDGQRTLTKPGWVGCGVRGGGHTDGCEAGARAAPEPDDIRGCGEQQELVAMRVRARAGPL